MNSWAKAQELKVSKSDIWLFCALLGNAILVISRNAPFFLDQNTLDLKQELARESRLN
jgi:hypothetical protein